MSAAVQLMNQDLDVLMQRIAERLGGKYRLTMICRYDGGDFEDADILKSDDDYEKASAAMRRLTNRDALKAQKPVAAQHRFRHPQKTMPDWSAWQPTAIADRPAWEIDSQGYEVEYRELYAAPVPSQDDEALLRQTLRALEDSIDAVRAEYEGDWRHGLPTREAHLRAMREAVERHEQTIAALKERLS